MSKKRKPRRDWSWKPGESTERFQAEVDSRRKAPFADVPAAMDFCENLRLVAVRGVNDSNAAIKIAETDEDADFASHERAFFQGVDAAARAVLSGTINLR